MMVGMSFPLTGMLAVPLGLSRAKGETPPGRGYALNPTLSFPGQGPKEICEAYLRFGFLSS